MSATELFLANVIALEGEAAVHYESFAQRALQAGDVELEAFFSGLAELTRLETNEARAGGGLNAKASVVLERLHALTDPPRSAIQVGGTAVLDVHRAMTQALELKRRSHAYYASMAALESDPTVRHMAQAFEAEGAAHMAALEQWIVRLSA
ncbi:MAG TPA: hypothetical protein VLC92_19210 [Rhodocyclaceae bacterium]|nr:hypothetical protein [Rhodocyclaceae bacterium]